METEFSKDGEIFKIDRTIAEIREDVQEMKDDIKICEKVAKGNYKTLSIILILIVMLVCVIVLVVVEDNKVRWIVSGVAGVITLIVSGWVLYRKPKQNCENIERAKQKLKRMEVILDN